MKLKDKSKELKIIEKTLAIVYEKGFSGIKMAELAKTVGISPSTLYVYFHNKEDLIVSICEKLLLKLTHNHPAKQGEEKAFQEELKELWFHWLNFGLNNAKEMSFLKQIKQSTYYEKVPEEVKQAKLKPGLALFQKGKNEGLIKNLNNEIIISLMSAITTETIKLINTNKSKKTETSELMYSILWDAIKA